MVESNEYLEDAIKSLQIADHMTYVTYPLIKDEKLLLKILKEINKCVVNCIKVIVFEEGKSWEEIFRRFLEKNSLEGFLNNEEIKKLKEILDFSKGYDESAMEFVRRDKVVMMSDDLSVRVLDVVRIKEYLVVAKRLMGIANKF